MRDNKKSMERFDELKEDIQMKLKASANYPPKDSDRSTEDGYPNELIYDEWAYRRMVDTYRDAFNDISDNFESLLSTIGVQF